MEVSVNGKVFNVFLTEFDSVGSRRAPSLALHHHSTVSVILLN